MAKIQAKAGDSLADIYNVVGSIAGIEQLETKELPIVHEMGGTVFSERLGADMRRQTSGSIAQSLNFDVVATGFGPGPVRILGVAVIVNAAGRLANLVVSLRDAPEARELPIFAWDSTLDSEFTIRFDDNTGGAANVFLLRPVTMLGNVPSMLMGLEQRRSVTDVVMRGTTLAFGAGALVATAFLYTASSHQGGLSSRGLPLPSW